MSACKVVEFSILTSCVDVKVGGFVSHIACSIQTWSPGMDFAGVAHILRYIHCVRALVNILTSKQHFHLDKFKTPLNRVVCPHQFCTSEKSAA